MAAILNLTTGVVFLVSWSGTISGGSVTLTGVLSLADGTPGSPSLTFTNDTDTGIYRETTNIMGFVAGGVAGSVGVAAGGLVLRSDTTIGFASTASISGTIDTILARDAANTLALKNGTNPQTFHIYGGADSAPTTATLAHLFLGDATVAGQTGNGNFDMGLNFYYNAGFKYRTTNIAGITDFNGIHSGEWTVATAISGTAGNAITWVDQLRINNSGTVTATTNLVAANGNVTAQGSLFSGGTQVQLSTKFITYNNTTTAGDGMSYVVGYGRFTAQTAAKATVATFTAPAADGTYEVSANVLVTTATTHTFTMQCVYTDEGNTSRTITMPFRLIGDTTALTSAIANGNGAVPYMGVPLHIRVKASTAITIQTQAAGTYTTVTYNVEGLIKKTAT